MKNLTRIIEGCIQNESKYQRMFYDRFRGFASKVVFRYIYRYDNAMDIVTDGFVKAFTHFHDFKLPGEKDEEKLVMAWLKKILINCAIDELRKKQMLPEIGGIEEDLWEISDRNDDADRLLLYADLILMIKDLPPDYRVVFNLAVLDGFSHTEIAEQLNIAVGTSKSTLSRAKALLKERIRLMEEGKLCRI